MAHPIQFSRRSFIQLTAAAGSGSGRFAGGQSGAADVQQPRSGETDYFWYREQQRGKYIDSQRGNKAFAYAEGKVFLSTDNARTWPHSTDFPDDSGITFSHILNNGNVLFATATKLYLSTDNLKSFREVIVRTRDGADYIPHTPKNHESPGWYFHTLSGVVSWDVQGKEMLVWGNYCNVVGGATPVNIYYSTDSGRTVKLAYSFGQNPAFTDTGAPGGGAGGTILGNPENKTIARHVHALAYNPVEKAFYATTGDLTRGFGHECHWLRGTYDAKRDRWKWDVIVSDLSNSRYKSGGLNFVDGKLYWVADSNGAPPYDRGVFACDPKDIRNPEKHTRLYNPEVESPCMIVQHGTFLATHVAPATPLNTGFIVSNDRGKTWAQFDLKEFGKRTPVRLHEKNGEGWFRVDLRSDPGHIRKAEVLFIKPKPPGRTA